MPVPPAELGLGDQPLTRVSIFLSVFDVHINRSPCAGTVDVVAYRPGKFVNAAADKASEDNERMAIALRRADGVDVGFVQIAGWVARRIVCYVKPGQALAAGERFGHIRFGSRTDLYLPAGARLLVAPGQRMIGGETVIAELNAADATPRAGDRVLGRGQGPWTTTSARRRGLRGFSINRLIPNVLTLAALCSGLTAIRFGLQGAVPARP